METARPLIKTATTGGSPELGPLAGGAPLMPLPQVTDVALFFNVISTRALHWTGTRIELDIEGPGSIRTPIAMDNTVTGLTTVRHDLVPFLAFPSRHQNDLSRRQCLIYMIPGNPGLVAYYEPFLRALRQLLDEREREAGCRYAFHIYGRSLLGFDDGDHEPRFGTITASGATTEPFTLEDQIRGVCGGIQGVNSGTLGDGRTFDQVILIGHSVGAYIALETFHRHHQARREIACTSDSLTSVNLKSGILLFPTVSHIAQSSSGQKLNRLRTTPLLDRTAHHVAKGFVSLWPVWILDAIVRRVMGFPDHAVATTLRFLTSADGIWQALHMGKDEMRCITEEKWYVKSFFDPVTPLFAHHPLPSDFELCSLYLFLYFGEISRLHNIFPAHFVSAHPAVKLVLEADFGKND